MDRLRRHMKKTAAAAATATPTAMAEMPAAGLATSTATVSADVPTQTPAPSPARLSPFLRVRRSPGRLSPTSAAAEASPGQAASGLPVPLNLHVQTSAQASAHPIRSSRSPFRDLLRSSTKRSRESPPGGHTKHPHAHAHAHTAHVPATTAPAAASAAEPGAVDAEASRPADTAASDGASASPGRPTMPAFLQISPEEIDRRFQKILFLERSRLQHASTVPGGRWARVAVPYQHLRVIDRYPNIQPWEANRVRLQVPPGRMDYLNASPVVLLGAGAGGGSGVDRFIAMQGPKRSSVDHVWRMVYEQLRSPAVIVMLTETHEGAMEKCFPYYPQHPDDPPMPINAHDEFGDGFHASVRCTDVEELLDGAIEQRRIVLRVHRAAGRPRTPGTGRPSAELRVSQDSRRSAESQRSSTARDDASTTDAAADFYADAPYEDERVIYHFLYRRWPDFGVPALSDLDSFFALMRLSADKNADPDNPRVVHCSAGVGRSGTFIALEHLQRELDAGVLEDWPAAVPDADGRADALDTDAETEAEARRGRDRGAESSGAGSPLLALALAGSRPETRGGSSALDEATLAATDLVFATVNALREQRRMMVQSEAQYHFLYQVLRKMWTDKYGGEAEADSESMEMDGEGSTDMDWDSDGEPADALGEPAAKRLEVDGLAG